MAATQPNRSEVTRQISWDGLSFLTPADWDMSQYHFGSRESGMRMEDDEAVRLELEWTRPSGRVVDSTVKRRYGKAAKDLEDAALETRPVDELPPGWTAFHYVMPENKALVTAFWLPPGKRFFCFLRLHFEHTGKRKPPTTMRAIADSFILHETGDRPWAVYDMSFTLDHDFRLLSTAFQAGRKLMLFEWALRRLFLWQFSVADILLKDKSPAEFACEQLKAHKPLRGVRFTPLDDTRLQAHYSWRSPLGNYEQIGRGCFRFDARVRHDPQHNTILICVFNHRRASDCERIKTLLSSLGIR